MTAPALGGKYLGESTLCETEPIMECFDPEHTKALLVVSGNDFTLYWRSEGMGFGTSYPHRPAATTAPFDTTCAKYAARARGRTTPAPRPGRAEHRVRADDRLRRVGRDDERADRRPPNGNGDFITFSLILDPD